MPSSTDISVIIPAYNAERTIRTTIEGVLAQNTPPLEILVMDDGSTDRTSDVVREFGERVRVLRQDNRGIAATRNSLFGAARGDWIALLDADDVWHPDYLQLQVDAIAEFPSAVASFTAYTDFYGSGTPPALRDDGTATTRKLLKGREFIDRYFEASGIALPSFALLSRSWVGSLGSVPVPSDLLAAEDTFLWYRAALDGAVCLTSASGGYYRVLPGSLSNDRVMAYLTRIQSVRRIYTSCLQGRDRQWSALVKRHLRSSYRAAAKHLAGDANHGAARKQLWESMEFGFDVKSALLWCSLSLPRAWQPSWPSRYRYLESGE